MSQAENGVLNRPYLRFVTAAVVVVVAFLLRHAMVTYIGVELPPFITFYPAVMIVVMLGGLWPALLATALACLLAAYWIFPPIGHFGITRTSDAFGLAFFCGMGLFMSLVAERYRRSGKRLAAYDNEMALREGKEKLRQSEEQFETLANAIPQLCWMANADGFIFWYNQRWYEYSGTTPQQMEGWGWQSVHDPEVLPKVVERWKASLATGEPFEMVFPLRGSDGVFRPFLTRVMPVKDAEDKVVRWFGTNTDISEQIETAQALRDSEERYSALFANKINAISHCKVITDNNGRPIDYRILKINEAYEKTIGIKRADVEGRTVKEVFPGVENYSFDYIGVLGRVGIAGGEIMTEVFLEATGQYLSLYAYSPKSGEFTAMFTDITDRKRAEQALRDSEERYRNLFDTMYEGFCVIEMIFDGQGSPADYRFLQVNPAFEKQTGLYEAEGKLMRELAPAHEKHWFEIYGKVALTGEPAHFVNEARELNRWYEVHAYRVGDPEKRQVAIVFNDISERKQAEDALRASEERLRLFIEHAPAALAMFDNEMRYLHASRRWLADYGLGDRDLRGLAHYEIFPEISEQWKDAHRRGLAGEVLRAEADRFERADGSVQWVRWEIRPWHNARGGVAGILIFAEEITERKKAEEALRASERRFRELADAMPQIVWASRPDGFLDYYNRKWFELTGAAEGEGGDQSWLPVMHPDDRQKCLDIWYESVQSGKPYQIEYRFKFPTSGEYRWHLGRALPVRDQDGNIIRWYGTCTDIHDVKKAEEALRLSEERLRITLQSIGDAVISTCAEGKVVFMNDVAQKLTGWSLEGAKGQDLRSIFNIVQEVTRIRPEDPVEKVIRLGKVVGLANHTVLIGRDGSEMPIDDSAAPIRNEQGQLEGVVLVFHDVSQQRMAERALRNNERLATTGRLAATIAHEIHNPLDAVGNLLYLIDQGTEKEAIKEYVTLASSELARVTQMTRQMLAFQREAAKPVPVHMSEILDSVLTLYERKLAAARISVEKRLDHEGEILALPGELRQVFANLVGNAMEVMRAGQGKITLHSYASRDWRNGRAGVRVVVADNGPGIPVEVRAKIFEPFFTTKGESGTGLGLWIAADIIRKYDGTMRLWSNTGNGRSGTCFSVFLPFKPKPESPVRG